MLFRSTAVSTSLSLEAVIASIGSVSVMASLYENVNEKVELGLDTYEEGNNGD